MCVRQSAHWHDTSTIDTYWCCIARGDTECWLLTLHVAFYTGQLNYDGKARRHIICDFIHQTC
jgi:hypothetical protein